MAKTVGPSTPNSRLAELLNDYIERQGQRLGARDYALLQEAADRIGERPDED